MIASEIEFEIDWNKGERRGEIRATEERDSISLSAETLLVDDNEIDIR